MRGPRPASRRAYADEPTRAWVRSFASDADQVPRRLPRPGAQGGVRGLRRDRHAASTGCCSRRRTRSSTRAASRPSCAASASRATCTACPTTRASARRRSSSASARSSRSPRRTATRTSSPATASWPRTPTFVAAIEQAGARLHGPVVARGAPGRREGRGQEARALARQLGDPGRRRRHARARCCARAADRARARGAREGARARVRAGTTRATLEENAEALLQAGYAKLVELFTIEELQARGRARVPRDLAASTRPPHPLQAHRRRRRQGPAHRRRGPSRCAAAVRDVLAESKVLPAPARTGTS